MSKLTSRQLALSLTGCFLGAGFVSGQELQQFFGAFGWFGFAGLLLMAILLALFCAFVFRLAKRSGIVAMDRILIPWDLPWLRRAVGAVQILFLFGIYSIMAAGVGSLVQAATDSPSLRMLVSAGFCLLITVVALANISWIVRIYSFIVPLLVLATIGISLAAAFRFGTAGIFMPTPALANPLLRNWLLSALTFVSYNLFTSIGLLASLGAQAPPERSICQGAAGGGCLLLLIAAAILSAMRIVPASMGSELPMLTIAAALHPFVAALYSILLCCAMFGAAMCAFVPIPIFFDRFCWFQRRRAAGAILLSGFAWLGSLLGFSTLIGTLYPLYGYLSFAGIFFLLCQVGKR